MYVPRVAFATLVRSAFRDLAKGQWGGGGDRPEHPQHAKAAKSVCVSA